MNNHVHLVLAEYLAHQLPMDDAERVAHHLAECAKCAKEYELIQRTLSQLANARCTPPESQYFKELLPAIQQRISRKHEFWLDSWGKSARLAVPLAALSLILLLVVFYPNHEKSLLDMQDLRTMVHSMKDDELNDIAVDQDKTAMMDSHHELTAAIVNEHLSGSGIMKSALRSDLEAGVLMNNDEEKAIQEFDNDQVDKLLVQLEERKNL